jgi:hypothetical protein
MIHMTAMKRMITTLKPNLPVKRQPRKQLIDFTARPSQPIRCDEIAVVT